MCLELIIKQSSQTKNKIGPERLSQASGLHIRKISNDLGNCLHFSLSGACSCDLLSKGKAQEKETWDLDPSSLKPLFAAVDLLGKEKIGFLFRALWLNETSAPPQKIKLAELKKMIESNKIKRNAPFIVGSYS